jgi:exonuclease SbcD
VLHGFDRSREHALVLEWLLETIEQEDVDALLVAGDVFDAANPPTEAQHLWYRFLVDVEARSAPQVVVVGGNHDSASRLDSTDPSCARRAAPRRRRRRARRRRGGPRPGTSSR